MEGFLNAADPVTHHKVIEFGSKFTFNWRSNFRKIKINLTIISKLASKADKIFRTAKISNITYIHSCCSKERG